MIIYVIFFFKTRGAKITRLQQLNCKDLLPVFAVCDSHVMSHLM